MKRHESLAGLSREHHGGLILAQLLKKSAPVYKGLPTDNEGKAIYAAGYYKDELEKHFEKEEQILIKKIRGINSGLDQVADEIIDEHAALRELFKYLQTPTELASQLDKIAVVLEKHIRKEERLFFPMIQELCSEEALAEIAKAFSA